ncbi:MAG: hypothetical protein M3261_04765, partial [Thermoproteota archaeon]|nr:hypothetical protein [Thermoproteota archaeon]
MNEDNGRDKSDNNNRVAKVLSAIAIGGIVVAASLLLSGLSVLGSYHSVLAQQNMTQSGGGGGGNATTTTGAMAGGNATTSMGGNQSEVRMHVQEARTALQNNDIQGAMMHLDLALNLVGGGAQGNM